VPWTCVRHCCASAALLRLSIASAAIGSAPFFLQRVLRKDGRDLRVRHGDPAGPKTGRDCRRIVFGGVDHGDEDLDDVRQGQSRGGRHRRDPRRGRLHHAAACLQLRRRALGVRGEVDVDGGDALAPKGPRLDEAAQRVVDPESEDRL